MSATSRPDRRRRRALRRQAVAGVAAVVVLGSGGTAAFAAFTVSGTGSAGQAKAVTRQNVTLSVPAVAVTADLYPGASGKISFTIDNPNSYPVRIQEVTLGAVTSDDPAACPASNITVTTPHTVSIDVLKNGTANASINNAVSMVPGALDGCANRTFTIAVSVTGIQTT